MNFFLASAGAYLIGSIPNGLIIGKLFWQIDLREHGSKNIGATNAYRTLGAKPAALIFIMDLLKGIIGVWLGSYMIGAPLAMILGGIAAIIGHNWSIFLKFTGGKGVATGLGVIAMLMPQVTIVVFVTWVVIVYLTKYVSLASIVAAMMVPVCSYFFNEPLEYLCFSILAAVFVIYRHKSNVQRLINGNESKIKAGNIDK
ncbi:MAG: Glycerol-3-phosphate acyltransferase [Massilibacillus sp.]|nr:Glycerol-3-phosphate acyltransferase [Massilibacillus sp.]